jgi:hypothetical protein
MTPTDEQIAAIKLFASRRSFAIEAGAGTGKTSTLVLLARSTDRRGQYVAFNKAIVTEAQSRMPGSVRCNTAHSLAYAAVGHRYRSRMNQPRMKSMEAARLLGLEPIDIRVENENKRLSAGWLSGLVNRSISAFCNTADPVPTAQHVPYSDGLDMKNLDGSRRFDNNLAVARHIEPAIRRAWADLQDINGKLRFNPDHYLKIWQLDEPVIRADYILFDEAQDASPVMLDIMARQTAQVVWVGDSQQQIYDWRGAVNALANVETSERSFLTQSFRFGQPIADVANAVLGRLSAELRLTGRGGPSATGRIAEPDAVLCRTNAGAFKVMLRYLAEQKLPHLVGGGAEIASFARAAQELMTGQRTTHPELSCFDNWGEVQDYVMFDMEGSDLRLMVDLIDEYGVPKILSTFEHMIPEQDADVVISTAHKAKGREWDYVQLWDDFPRGYYEEDGVPKGKPLSPSDWRLVYVAATRARQVLDFERVDVLCELFRDEHPAALTEG